MDLKTAEAKLVEMAKKYETELNEWSIRIIKEGELFDACFDD